MGHDIFSSHPRYHPPKKRTTVSYQNPTLQTPWSPKHPGTGAGEDPHHQKPSEITVESVHKSLLLPTKSEHDTPERRLVPYTDVVMGWTETTTYWPQSGHHPTHLFLDKTFVLFWGAYHTVSLFHTSLWTKLSFCFGGLITLFHCSIPRARFASYHHTRETLQRVCLCTLLSPQLSPSLSLKTEVFSFRFLRQSVL